MVAVEAMDIGSKLIGLLTKQQMLYRQLQSLSKKQRVLVDGKDPESLLRLLAGRQRLINKLTAVGRELAPIRDDWQAIAKSLPRDKREKAMALVASIQELLGDVVRRDNHDVGVLSSQKQEVAGQIKFAGAGRRVNRAYSQGQPEVRSVFDTECQ